MTVASELRDTFTEWVNRLGTTGSITAGSVSAFTAGDYDSVLITGSYTRVGSVFVAGINERQDRQWLEQGRVNFGDVKMYVPSGTLSQALDDLSDVVTNAGSWHVVGIDDAIVQGELVYRKAYLRAKRP